MKKHLTFVFATAAFIGTSAAAQSYDWKAPGSASKKANPVPASATALAKGKALYSVQCVVCHGASGHGDGPAAAALVPKPRNLTDPAIQGESDGAMFWKLTQGRAPMPAFAGVSEEERWSVIHYIRSLGGGAVKRGPAPKPKPAASALPAAKSLEPDPTALALIPQAELQTGPVSREEYNALLQRMAELEKRLVAAGGQSAAREVAVDQSLSELAQKSESTSKLADSTKPGTTKFLIAGYGFAGFEDRPGKSGKFNAGVNPILLWKLNDRLFFESELEFTLAADGTDVNLEYANLSYLLNDYMTVKAGKFLAPFGTFADRYHPAWINKLPDHPLALTEGGIAPFAQTGVQISGGFPVGRMKLNYALYAANGPQLITDTTVPADIGRFEFGNFTDTNSRAYGGRIGILPIPELEFGYSFQQIAGPANARLHSVDLSYAHEFDAIKGMLDVRSQWAWSDAGRFLAVSEAEGETITFDNRRNGGYVQLAYRPTKAKGDWLRNVELVGRWERLNQPTGLTLAGDEVRWTVGLNYWLGPSTVLKAGYEFIRRNGGESGNVNGNALLFQAAMGF